MSDATAIVCSGNGVTRPLLSVLSKPSVTAPSTRPALVSGSETVMSSDLSPGATSDSVPSAVTSPVTPITLPLNDP